MVQRGIHSNEDGSPDDCILYELLVYSEWKPDPEYTKSQRFNDNVKFNVSNSSSFFNILHLFGKRDETLDGILRLQLRQMPWLFAVGDNGKVVAVLQENLLEIRIARDEYSSVVGKAVVNKDPFPQWRKLAWSPDCSMLAVAHSSGVISFYDLLGSNIFTIFPSKRVPENKLPELQNPLASIVFVKSRIKSPKWSSELLAIDYQGYLTSYLVSPTDSFQENHNFSFSCHYHHGVFAAAYHPAHNVLFVAGSSGSLESTSLEGYGAGAGLSAWRVLNDYPYYKLAMPAEEQEALLQAQRSLWNWVPAIRAQPKKSTVFKMEISPQGRLLACLHSCSSISVWRLPSLRRCSTWELTQQPGYNIRNPHILGFSKPKLRQIDAQFECWPIDINWWSEQAMIVARLSGAVSVCSVANLRNLLGESPEFLAGQPRISSMCNERGFLGLECETHLAPRKASHDDLLTVQEAESTDDDEEEEEASLLNRSSALLQSAVYLITDIERFQPKRKRPRVLHKTYRLLGLKSTTPEELYARKIDNEEYGDALDLARTYNLDCDLVYQRQWRNSKVSIHTIRDYLSKITKRAWVLRECVQRVPETLEAAQELLEFGLQGTNLETLLAIGEGTDGGHFVLKCSVGGDRSDFLGEDGMRQKEVYEKLLARVHTQKLTGAQQELLLYRRKLLWYLDMLHTYKKIEGESSAVDTYNHEVYDQFRNAPVLESAVEFAREGRWHAVRVLLTYHSSCVLPHWLPVLTNFPETMNPVEYEVLLPECDTEGHVFPWDERTLRSRDWCEQGPLIGVCEPEGTGGEDLLYAGDPELAQFSSSPGNLTSELLSEWYSRRVRDIEQRSCVVDHALTLVKLAEARHIQLLKKQVVCAQGLQELHEQLQTLEALVYDVRVEDITLLKLQKMTDLEKAKLLLSNCTHGTLVSDVRCVLLPFLLRCERRVPGTRLQLLRGCLLEMSSCGLGLPLLLFEHLRAESSSPLASWEETVSLALDCLYAYPHADELENVARILQCAADRSSGRVLDNTLRARLEEAECELEAATILRRNGLTKALAHIRDCKSNTTSVQQLLIRLARHFGRQVPPPNKMLWDHLLTDMLTLHTKVFTSISLQIVYEMYAETLLSSGVVANIHMASDILEVGQGGRGQKWVPFDRSVALVLQVSREYFDSASSLLDPAMDLAKACLHLITDEEAQVEENLDLIASLQLLSDFGLNMLPLHVRQSTDRLRLVEACVRKKPLAYRNSHRLLQLAQKLRVAGADSRQREGRVLTIIAEVALEEKDYKYCADICQRVVSSGYAGSWEVVQRLGQCADFPDLKLRYSLLAFALLHCPASSLEPLVNARCLLEAEMLHKEVNSQVEPGAVEGDEEFSDALTSPGSPQKEFIPTAALSKVVGRSTEAIKETTYSLIQNISSRDFWRTSFSWGGDVESPLSEEEEDTSPLSRQGMPAFYASLLPDCHVSRLDTRYSRCGVPEQQDRSLHMCQMLLRTVLLEQTISAGTSVPASPDVLCALGARLLPEDAALGLAHLLAVPEPGRVARVEQVFRELPCTALSLQLATYCLALCGRLQQQGAGSTDTFLLPPAQLVPWMVQQASELEPQPAWADALCRWYRQLCDYIQGQQLQTFGCGVDLERFSHDEQYRRESILGLALTVDQEQFELAVGLGARHGVPVGEVAAMHVNALFLAPDSEILFPALAARLNDADLLQILSANPNTVCERLTQYVYPSLMGEDHQRLVLYYTLMNSIAELYITQRLPPKEHVKLLKKVKAITPAIDYKALVSGTQPVLAALRPMLRQDNVGVVARLVRALPSALQDDSAQPGAVYGAWAQLSFFQVPEGVETGPNLWQQQYEACTKLFGKMEVTDMVEFAHGVCFCEEALEQVPREGRCSVLEQLRALCAQRAEQASDPAARRVAWGSIGIISMPDGFLPALLTAAGLRSLCRERWRTAELTLASWLQHLDRLSAPPASLTAGGEARALLRQLEMARGEAGPLAEVLRSAVCSEVELSALQQLLALLPPPPPSLQQLLERLLADTVDRMRESASPAPDSLSLLAAVLRRLHQSPEPLAAAAWHRLEALCGDSSLAPALRLQVSGLLAAQSPTAQTHAAGAPLHRLLLHHSQAAVALAWPHDTPPVSEDSLASDASRRQTFAGLLACTSTWAQATTLAQLLQRWPPFETLNGRNTVDEPWLQCIQKLLGFEEALAEEQEQALESIFQHNSFPEESLQEVVRLLDGEAATSPLLLLCLLPDCSGLHRTATVLLHQHCQAGSKVVLSRRVLRWLVQRGLAPAAVGTAAYPQLVELLLSSAPAGGEGDGSKALDLGAVCAQLATAGHLAEAGTLQMQASGVPPALCLFSTALLLGCRLRETAETAAGEMNK